VAFDLICQAASVGLGVSQILALLYPIFVYSREFRPGHFVVPRVTREEGSEGIFRHPKVISIVLYEIVVLMLNGLPLADHYVRLRIGQVTPD
jgi:hypothetical protein